MIDSRHECNIFFIVVDDDAQSSSSWVSGIIVIEIVDSEGTDCPCMPRGADRANIIVPRRKIFLIFIYFC